MTVGSVNLPINKYDKFNTAAEFRGRGFNWVDPAKEVNANVVALQNGLISMQDVANNYGRDIEEVFAQIARDKETAKQFGLKMAFEPFGGGLTSFGMGKIDLETGKPIIEKSEDDGDGNTE